MPLFLYAEIRRIKIRDKRPVWLCLETKLVQRPRARDNLLVCIDRTALCGKQIIVSIYFIQMRPFHEFHIRTVVNVSRCFRF